jgi:hypothetical protein
MLRMTIPRLFTIGFCLLMAVYTTITGPIFRHGDSIIVGSFAEHRAPTPLPIDPNRLLLAASFGASLNPKDIEIIPYYKRAKRTPELRDISICTLVTPERREMLESLASVHDGKSGYDHLPSDHVSSHVMLSVPPLTPGPTSVTYHLRTPELLSTIDEMWSQHPTMYQNVDIHVYITPHLREFNTHRNIARLFARTDYMLQVGIDFTTTTDFRGRVLGNATLMGMLESGDNVLVLPAFQYREHANAEPALEDFPKSKKVGR